MRLLESVHLYRKVPRDLTDATCLGGFMSIGCALMMAFLFVSNTSEYMSVAVSTDVELDESSEAQMRIYFNLTMERLPCQFASLDLSDVMGTSLMNVTQHIIKFKVAPDEGHRAEFYREADEDILHEDLSPAEQAAFPDELPTVDDRSFEALVKASDTTLVSFGAPWCPWSQRLEPVWRKTYALLKDKPYAHAVRMGKVDCTSPTAQATCQQHHIHAFPTIRIYRHRQLHSHENYLGDRDSSAFLRFIEETLPAHLLKGQPSTLPQEGMSMRTASASTVGEGCRITGSLQISRVPGSFRIAARSASHSFNTRVMNVSHHVDKLLFGYLDEHPYRLHQMMDMQERSALYSRSFTMHQEMATLKHYLKVVPFQRHRIGGEFDQTYLYKANYNEYRPRKLEWYEGKADAMADAHVDTQMVPNVAFHYDISPIKVATREETAGFAAFVTKICAVIGGLYTFVGLIDNTIYHSTQAISKRAL